MISPPDRAPLRALVASCVADFAESADALMEAAICSVVAAVSSSAAACDSLRDERLFDPPMICSLVELTVSVATLMLRIVSASRSIVALS